MPHTIPSAQENINSQLPSLYHLSRTISSYRGFEPRTVKKFSATDSKNVNKYRRYYYSQANLDSGKK